MSHPGKTPPAITHPLSVNDLRFIEAYQRRGWTDQTHAYMEVSPKAKYPSAAVTAYRRLKLPHMKAEIQRRVKANEGITKAFVHGNQLSVIEGARAASNLDLLERANMNAAKLIGLLIEKREEVVPAKELMSDEILAELQKRATPCLN